jgi:hypothetical protein
MGMGAIVHFWVIATKTECWADKASYVDGDQFDEALSGSPW